MATANVPTGIPANVMPPNVNVNNVPAPAAAPRPVQVPEDVQNGEADEDLRPNRDWLDWFYLMSRTMVLFSIVYFYSSPVRFFFVSTLGLIMYLYQIGFFRALQRIEQQEEEERGGGEEEEEEEEEEEPDTPPPTPDNNNVTPPATPPLAAPSALAVTWAAFSSFFLSLIPEQQNVL